MTTFEPFALAAGAAQDLAPEGAGRGVAAVLAERLGAAGWPAASGDYQVGGTLQLGAGEWRGEIVIHGPLLPQPARRTEAAGLDQPHHLLCRLFEFAALTLGVSPPEPVIRGFDDYRSASPAAWLEWLAGHNERAFELDPLFPAPRIALARRLLARGQAGAAAALLEGVAVADPGVAAELGLAFWAEGLEGPALALLPSAVQGNSDNAIAHAALAALLARHGSEEARAEALLLATRATELASDDYRCWAALADAHRAANDLNQAAFFYGMALRLEPDAPSVLKDAAANWLMARQPDKALPLIERALEKTPDDADHHGNLAFAYTLLERREPALAAARRAVELRPNDARLHVLHGEMALAAQHKDEALDAWARATELDASLLLSPHGGNLGLTAEP